MSNRIMISNSLKQLLRVLVFRFSAFHFLNYFLNVFTKFKEIFESRVCSSVSCWKLYTGNQKMWADSPDILRAGTHPLLFTFLIYKHSGDI